MRSARYGRMRLGQCVTADLGYVGCSADVLDLVDAMCSGRRSCTVQVPNQALAARSTCMHELKLYLEASYSCLKGEFRHRVAKKNSDNWLVFGSKIKVDGGMEKELYSTVVIA